MPELSGVQIILILARVTGAGVDFNKKLKSRESVGRDFSNYFLIDP